MYSIIQKGKTDMRFIAALIFAATAVIALLYWQASLTDTEEALRESAGAGGMIVKNAASKKNDSAAVSDTKDWKQYENNVLGISFLYPEKWGEPQTVPYRYLTDLKAIANNYGDTEANIYRHSVAIEFIDRNTGERKGPAIDMFTDQYAGRLFPNGYALHLGPADNFDKLRQTGDICDYKVFFDKRPAYLGTAEELYSDCSGGVKSYVAKMVQASNDGAAGWADYEINHAAFRKLQNGYFDNMLASQYVWSGQSDNKALVGEDIFDINKNYIFKEPLDAEFFSESRDDLAAFMRSVNVFVPKPSGKAAFETRPEEDPSITLIREYYYAITEGDLKRAYGMYADGGTDFIEYEKWYGGTITANPTQFEKIGDGKYRFNVQYQDKNSDPESYRVVMEIKKGKIIPVSSEKIISSKVAFENMTAFTAERQGKSYLTIAGNEGERVIDEGATDPLAGVIISGGRLSFSPKGSYLTSGVTGWEWYGARIYEVKTKKKVKEVSMYADYGFTPDEKYFYACAASEFSGDFYAYVLSVPDFEVKYCGFNDARLGYRNIACDYDGKKGAIVFTASDLYDPETMESLAGEKTVEFSTETGEIVENKTNTGNRPRNLIKNLSLSAIIKKT